MSLESFSQDHLIDSCNFLSDCPFITLNNNDTNNIWQIGTTSKFIDTLYSKNKAIITDTLNPYKINSNSFFEVYIPNGVYNQQYFNVYPSVAISFHHKFQTDSLLDGGYIMVSNDKQSWENICSTTHPMIYSNNLYSTKDTLYDGTPAFSGQRDWIWSSIKWFNLILLKGEFPDTIFFRFYFKSDSIQTNKGGWIIDEIKTGWDFAGGISEMNGVNKIKIFPNPASDKITIEGSDETQNLFIYNFVGDLILQKQLRNNKNEIIPTQTEEIMAKMLKEVNSRRVTTIPAAAFPRRSISASNF